MILLIILLVTQIHSSLRMVFERKRKDNQESSKRDNVNNGPGKMTVTHKRDIISHLTCCDDILVIYQVIIVLGIEAAGTHDDTNDVLLDRLLHTE